MRIVPRMVMTLSIIVVATVTHGVSLAEEPSERSPRPSVRAMGEATVIVKPDQAQIDMGVVTQSPAAQAAVAQNAQKLDSVLPALRKVLGPDAEIKTISYSVSPIRVYPKEGGEPKITGYVATNLIRVKTNDLTQVGAVIDTATQSGANNVHDLQFTLRDDQAARLEALQKAATRAKAQAQAIASALDLKIVRVISAEEGGSAVQPVFLERMSAGLMGKAATPVEPGAIEVRATVTVTVEVAQ